MTSSICGLPLCTNQSVGTCSVEACRRPACVTHLTRCDLCGTALCASHRVRCHCCLMGLCPTCQSGHLARLADRGRGAI